jgi:hypothetical protein
LLLALASVAVAKRDELRLRHARWQIVSGGERDAGFATLRALGTRGWQAIEELAEDEIEAPRYYRQTVWLTAMDLILEFRPPVSDERLARYLENGGYRARAVFERLDRRVGRDMAPVLAKALTDLIDSRGESEGTACAWLPWNSLTRSAASPRLDPDAARPAP